MPCCYEHVVIMTGVAEAETRKFGEGIVVHSTDLVSRVFTPSGEMWGHGQGGVPFFYWN